MQKNVGIRKALETTAVFRFKMCWNDNGWESSTFDKFYIIESITFIKVFVNRDRRMKLFSVIKPFSGS